MLAIMLLAMLLWLGNADCRSVEAPANVVNQVRFQKLLHTLLSASME